MRRLVLLVAALALAALVLLVLVLARTSAPPATPDLVPDAPAQDPILERTAQPPLASDAETERRPAGSAAPPASSERAEGDCALHVRVTCTRDAGSAPVRPDLAAVDGLGRPHVPERIADGEFLFPALAPGIYVLRADEPASMAVFRRVDLVRRGAREEVELVLPPAREIEIRWRTTDGRPITAALAEREDAIGARSLDVHASLVELRPEGPLLSDASAGALHVDAAQPRNDRTMRSSGLLELVRRSSEGDTDVVGTLVLRTSRPVWLSAWLSGEQVDAQRIPDDRDRVEFTTALDDAPPAQVAVSLCVLDDVTEVPVPGVRIEIESLIDRARMTDEHGCAQVQVMPGWATLRLLPESAREHAASAAAGGSQPLYVPFSARIRVPRGEPIDLGRLHLKRASRLRFRVVGADGRAIAKAQTTLTRLPGPDADDQPLEVAYEWTDERGLASFVVQAGEDYVVDAVRDELGTEPRLVRAPDPSVAGDVVSGVLALAPARSVVFVVDDPPITGTVLVVETPSGLPVRRLEIEESGVVQTTLPGKNYKIRLVEGGRVTPSVAITVDADPFVLTIHR